LLRRGFKSQCERRSVEVRRAFGLKPAAPLSAVEYAAASGVKVWKERGIEGLPPHDLEQLTMRDPDSWSAFTIRIGDRYLVVFNSVQSAQRTNSVVMHELAHILLGHKLMSAGVTDDGHLVPTVYDQDQEDEANWLAGTLLLPRPALLNIRYHGMTDSEAIGFYNVSEDMLRWRFRMTGVDYQLAARG
jgi:hypothetical protein